jgi:hypothetical protein
MASDLPHVARLDLPSFIQLGRFIDPRGRIMRHFDFFNLWHLDEHGEDGIDLGGAEAGEEGVELVVVVFARVGVAGEEAGFVSGFIVVHDGDVGMGEAEGDEARDADMAGDEEAVA